MVCDERRSLRCASLGSAIAYDGEAKHATVVCLVRPDRKPHRVEVEPARHSRPCLEEVAEREPSLGRSVSQGHLVTYLPIPPGPPNMCTMPDHLKPTQARYL